MEKHSITVKLLLPVNISLSLQTARSVSNVGLVKSWQHSNKPLLVAVLLSGILPYTQELQHYGTRRSNCLTSNTSGKISCSFLVGKNHLALISCFSFIDLCVQMWLVIIVIISPPEKLRHRKCLICLRSHGDSVAEFNPPNPQIRVEAALLCSQI